MHVGLTLPLQVCETRTACFIKDKQQQKDGEPPGIPPLFLGPAMLSVATVNNNFQNSPPVITSTDKITILQDCGTIYMPLQAYDADGDELAFQLVQLRSEMTALRKEILTDEWLVYAPCRSCSGVDVIHFEVVEIRTDSHEPLSTQGQIEIHITSINDNPYIMITMDATDISRGSNDLTLPMEENAGENVAYSDLEILVLAYDADEDDDLVLQLESPVRGNMTLYGENSEIKIHVEECGNGTGNARSDVWDSLVEQLKMDSPSIDLSLPCDYQKPLDVSHTMSWLAVLLVYQPEQFFYGDDQIKVKQSYAMCYYNILMLFDIYFILISCSTSC